MKSRLVGSQIVIADVFEGRPCSSSVVISINPGDYSVSQAKAQVRGVPVLLHLEINRAGGSQAGFEFDSILSVDHGCIGIFIEGEDAPWLTYAVDDNLYPIYAAGDPSGRTAIRIVLHDLNQDLSRGYRIPSDLLKGTDYDPTAPQNEDYFSVSRVLHDAEHGCLLPQQEEILRQRIGEFFRVKDYTNVVYFSKFIERQMTPSDRRRFEIARKRM